MSVSVFHEKSGTPDATEKVLYQASGLHSHTGNAALTTILTHTVPGGLMGPNDIIEIEHFWTFVGNTESRTCRVEVGGSAVFAKGGVSSANNAIQSKSVFRNNNSLTAQKSMDDIRETVYLTTSGAPESLSINTASDFDIRFRAQLGTDGSDTIELTGVKITLVRAVL